jgi:CubicO group peptidase (beta-lactamase class C family)
MTEHLAMHRKKMLCGRSLSVSKVPPRLPSRQPTEPTLSGLHDLERVAELTRHFGIPTLVCVNKWDLNPEVCERIEARAQERRPWSAVWKSPARSNSCHIETMKVLMGLLIVCAGMAFGAELSRVESIFAPLADGKSPGLAVLVRKDGKTILARGYGVRDLRTMAPIDASTDFRLASFTKQFTAMAVMLLAHDGKLQYEEKLTQIFPDFPDYGRTITVRNLLTHTSGLPDYEELMNGGPWTESRQIQDDEVLTLLERRAAPKFAAGTSWAYSNSGFVVLGLIVAKVSGVPFDEFLRERIFQPLHMNGTLVYIKGKSSVPNRAFGHEKQEKGFVEADQSPTSATQGDGGVYTNLGDLAKWDQALENHTLLGEAEMKPALTAVRLEDGSETHWPVASDADNLNPGKPVAYGFGWFLDPYAGRARMWHSGSTRGFSTVIERFTAEKLTIVVLSNRTDLDASNLALQAADALR